VRAAALQPVKDARPGRAQQGRRHAPLPRHGRADIRVDPVDGGRVARVGQQDGVRRAQRGRLYGKDGGQPGEGAVAGVAGQLL